MKPNTASFLARILPYIGIGIFIVILAAAFILLSYILLIGAVIGFILFVITYVKQRFFVGKSKAPMVVSKKQPRVFDNDEFK